MTTIDCETARPGEFPQTVRVRSHMFSADVAESAGSTDSAPGPHDFFDVALATCKALTATWYARRHKIPLERVETRVESDGSEERAGVYKLRVKVTFHGEMSDEQRASLYRAISACPIHKLMTTVEVVIETVD
jgi:putative redox protein